VLLLVTFAMPELSLAKPNPSVFRAMRVALPSSDPYYVRLVKKENILVLD